MSETVNRGNTRRSIAGSDLRERTLGVGDPQAASRAVGQHRARYVTLSLTGGGAVGTERVFDVLHDLGEIPTLCELVEWENAATAGTYLIAKPETKARWTTSSAKVRILLVAGSFDACQAVFRVSGA